MASLYYELEDDSGDLQLEDGTGNYLLEPIVSDFTRVVKTVENFTVTAVLES